MLMTALRVFNAIHSQVFRTLAAAPADPNPTAGPGPIADWDARAVMAGEKARVLAGVHLVFSRVIPLESDPQQHPLWLLAEQFGATCSVGCTDNTTHVVATHGGTEKVGAAAQCRIAAQLQQRTHPECVSLATSTTWLLALVFCTSTTNGSSNCQQYQRFVWYRSLLPKPLLLCAY